MVVKEKNKYREEEDSIDDPNLVPKIESSLKMKRNGNPALLVNVHGL